MPNPYAGRPRQHPAQLPFDRLRRLGASEEMLVQMQGRFIQLTVDERREMVQELADRTDDELQEEFTGLIPPDGSAKDVMTWVRDDPRRALAALRVEELGKNRGSLKSALQKIVNRG